MCSSQSAHTGSSSSSLFCSASCLAKSRSGSLVQHIVNHSFPEESAALHDGLTVIVGIDALAEPVFVGTAYSGIVGHQCTFHITVVVVKQFCQIVKHIADSMYDDVPAVFVNTGLEYPDIQKFAMNQNNVVTVRPEMRFDQVVREYGYPVVSKTISKKVGTVSRKGKDCKTYRFFEGKATTKSGKPSKFNCKKWAFLCDAPFKIDYFCCEVMKKQPFRAYEERTGRKPIAAVMACESDTREAVWMKTGCNAFEGTHQISNPMSFWTEQDVLHYIMKYMQKPLDEAWNNINSCDRRTRKAARKILREYN